MIYLYYFFIALFLLFCPLVSALVLLQESKSFGLGASFGGGATSLFGTSTAQVLKTITAWCATIFAIACFLLSVWTSGLEKNQTDREMRALQQVQQ